MSGIGFSELILVFLIGLIVLGPERLPRVAHQLGSWLGQARRMTRMMKRQLEDELNLEKDLNIRRPPPLPRAVPPAARPQEDDRYSPAHAAGAPGTGVGSDDGGPSPAQGGEDAAGETGEGAQPDDRLTEDRSAEERAT